MGTHQRFEEFSAGITQTLESYQQRAQDVAVGVRQLHASIGYVTMDEFREFRTSYTEDRLRTEQIIASLQRTLAEMSESLKGTAEAVTALRLQGMLTAAHSSENTPSLEGIQVQLRSIESKCTMYSQTIAGLQEQLGNIGEADAARIQSFLIQIKGLEGRMDSRSTMQAERIARIEAQLDVLTSVEAKGEKSKADAHAGPLTRSPADSGAHGQDGEKESAFTVMESQLSSLENIVKLQRVRTKEALTAITEIQEKVQNISDNHYITMDEFREFSRSIANALEAVKKTQAQTASEDTDYVTVDEFCKVCNFMTSKVKEHATVIASFQKSIGNSAEASAGNTGFDLLQGRPIGDGVLSSTGEGCIPKDTQERLARIETKIDDKLDMAKFEECFGAIEVSVKELAQFTTLTQEQLDSLELRVNKGTIAA